jgi:hypothetical protein
MRNVTGFLSDAGKRRMWLKYRGIGKTNLEFGVDVDVDVGHSETF